MRAPIASLVAALALWCGCSGDLPPSSGVVGLRLLAVRAEPPEVAPGATTILDTLTVAPPTLDGGAPSPSYLWLACPEAPEAFAPSACSTPDDGGAMANVPSCAVAPAAPLCLIGASPTVRFTPPPDGSSVVITVIVGDASAGGAIACAMDAARNGGAPSPGSACVVAVKGLSVTRSATPNHNPTLDALTLDGMPLTDGSARFTAGGAPRTLAATRTAGSSEIELCAPGDAACTTSGQREPLSISWFATAGAIASGRTPFQPAPCDDACLKADPPPSVSTQWSPPADGELAAAEVDFWAVVRDGRGGVGWLAGRAAPR
jgi:hypothetical protein